ncbi:hypothetical protein FE810_15300 [Thalassotalea litorea]|uniref:Uncharacterized protein n=1 Tax=Thalassotalea litorea TaxID=2020715 RepID=A0A5R9ICV6_9GAMM|nr:hypothetical protein [Thalassotalea litorea]TLU61193.1 hypothetical protein FE810_15300 [Thalassotalea litorea]
MTMEWQSLTKTQKFLITLALMAVLPFAPELLLIADIAGIEILFSCVVIYYRPLILKVCALYDYAKESADIILACVRKSAIKRPSVYFPQACFCSLTLVFLGAGSFALVFLMPGFLLPGYV